MAELGDTELPGARSILLNEATSMDILRRWWRAFVGRVRGFPEQCVPCKLYLRGTQKVVIDCVAGTWAALSAITRFEGATYAYNLLTGVARAYRARTGAGGQNHGLRLREWCCT
jgi:hypothetical protein